MRILGIIPARGGSKGVPGKNIKLLNGKPLLAYTAEIARQSALLTTLIVSSDDTTIIEVAKQMGIAVPFVRPLALAQDESPTIDVVKDALEWFGTNGVYFDAVCLLQVTTPFRTVAFLNEAINKFINTECDSLVSVLPVPAEYNPHWTFERDTNGYLKIATGENKIISRRQDLPAAFHRDGSIYITKTEVVLKQNSLFGEKISFIESNPEFYVNIDTPEDWEVAERIARKLPKQII